LNKARRDLAAGLVHWVLFGHERARTRADGGGETARGHAGVEGEVGFCVKVKLRPLGV